MLGFKCIFVEKKKGFNVEAKSLMEDFKSNLRINNLKEVRVVNKYIVCFLSTARLVIGSIAPFWMLNAA